MFPAAFRFSLCAAVLLGLPGLFAAEATPRTTPSRPGGAAVARSPALATRKFDGIDYVDVADVASRLGLKLAWLERGQRLTLAGPGARAELEAGTRDITVNGLRVFLGHPTADSRGRVFISRVDYERCLAPLLRPGHQAALPQPVRTIVLDPGHGGHDQGTSIHEKTFALDVAQRTKKILEGAGLRVILTRDDDTYVEHAQRAAIANAGNADAFVSIHFNALENNSTTSGVEVYTLPPLSQRSTNSWSLGRKPDAENESSPGNAFDHWNVVLAQALHRELVQDLKASDRGKKLMFLKVLRPLKCPGVLVECGFLTSEMEARKIATPAYRDKIAQAIAAGVREYAATVERVRPKK